MPCSCSLARWRFLLQRVWRLRALESATMRAISAGRGRWRPSSELRRAARKKRLSRCSMFGRWGAPSSVPTRVFDRPRGRSPDGGRRRGGCSCRSARPPRRASGRACRRSWQACPRSVTRLVGDRMEGADCAGSTWALGDAALRSDTSFHGGGRNSETRENQRLLDPRFMLSWGAAQDLLEQDVGLARRPLEQRRGVGGAAMLCGLQHLGRRLAERGPGADCSRSPNLVLSCSSFSVRLTVVVAFWLASLTRAGDLLAVVHHRGA